MIKRRSLLAGLPAMLVLPTVGCAPDTAYGEVEPRAVSQEESEKLAVMRLNNYERHLAPLTISVIGGQNLWLEGRVDFQDHQGFGSLQVDADPDEYALLYWELGMVAAVGTRDKASPEQPPADAPWRQRPLDPDKVELDTVLALALSLAADRPENPVLLRQNGAQWHGKATVDEVAVEVFSGPGADNNTSDRLLYFLDAEGQLRRLTAKLPQGGSAVLEFPPGEADAIQPLPGGDETGG